MKIVNTKMDKNKTQELIKSGDLIRVQNKLLYKADYEKYLEYKQKSEHADMLQATSKVLLNSQYGSTLSAYCRFHDPRIGASTTGSGRQITREMADFITAKITDSDDYKIEKSTMETKDGIENQYTIGCPRDSGVFYSDTDSVKYDSLVEINGELKTIEEFFNIIAAMNKVFIEGEKQILQLLNSNVFTNIITDNIIENKKISAIYRHKTNKRLWRIESESGKFIDITEDHSIMIDRFNKLESSTVSNIRIGDILTEVQNGIIEKNKIVNIHKLQIEEQYVYDIVMEDVKYPYFIANGILVHNSCYFSIDKLSKEYSRDKEEQYKFMIEYSDNLSKDINKNFIKFMNEAFLCTEGFDNLITANREVVASSAIWIAKKKYILNVIDSEGTRIDQDSDKAIKTLGSDIKLTSVPKQIRKFIKDVTTKILRFEDKEEINKFIVDFRENISGTSDVNIFDFASISSINNYETYYDRFLRMEKNGGGKANLPGQARASINHNEMVELFNDKQTPKIKGGKIKIIWLKPNQFNFSSIAFSTDQDILPSWFYENFEPDLRATEEKMIDQKLNNILKTMDWEVPTKQTQLKNSLLEF